MSEFLQFLFFGLGRGAVYATLALALVIIYRSTGLLNFAQGQMAMFSTYIVWALHNGGIGIWPAVVVGMVISFVLGAAIERLLIRPVERKGQGVLPVVIVTIGLFLALGALAPLIWGPEAKTFPRIFGGGSVQIAGASIDHQVLGTIGALVAQVVALWLLFQRTRLGLAMRAVASNTESAALVGVPVGLMLMVGWGLAAASGTIAGVSVAYLGVDASLMLGPLVYAFAAATLGGFDSPVGAVAGGLVVGVVTEMLAHYVDVLGNDLKLVSAFVLILVVLVVRPQGLFGRTRAGRV